MRTARQILADAHTIAVVGASGDPQDPAHWVPKMLQEQGWRIIPVNPHAERLFGENVSARLADIREHVDVVEVFRPAQEAVELVREAAAIGAGAIWLQLGITNPQARMLAYELGLDYVEDTCMGMERALADMVHGGNRPCCTIYHGIDPEPERQAALVEQR
jgi:predicted CoA-binding protein